MGEERSQRTHRASALHRCKEAAAVFTVNSIEQCGCLAMETDFSSQNGNPSGAEELLPGGRSPPCNTLKGRVALLMWRSMSRPQIVSKLSKDGHGGLLRTTS